MRSLLNVLRSRLRVAVATALVMAVTASVALAYFTGALASGSNAAAAAQSLPQGNTPTVSLSGANVTVSWSQNQVGGQQLGGYTGGGYKITRYPAAGGSGVTPLSSCSTTISGTTSTLTCTENSVPAGSWKYTVTPVLNNWVGVESGQSATVSTGSIGLSPTTGHVGDTVTISGSNFPANSAITATYAGTALTLSPASPTTDGSGNLSVTFTVPASTQGSHTVKVTAGGQSASASFTVQPKIALTPTSGGAGSSDSISGTGFAASSTITATFGGSSVTLGGTTSTDSTGSFSAATYTVPGTTAAGSYSVAVTDGSNDSATTNYTVSSGPATQIVLSGSTSSLASGTTRTLTATIEDAVGNTVTSGPDSNDSITFTQSAGTGSLTGLTSVAASGGVATDTVTGNTAGPVTLQASGTINSVAKTSNTLSLTVTFGTATHIVLSGSIADLASATTRQVTATIEDAAGNRVTSGPDSTDGITFTQSAGTGSVTGLTSAAASGGVATDTVTGNTAGPVTLQASGTINSVAKTSNTLSLTVTFGTATHIVLSGSIADLASATTRPVTATIEDAAGNTVTSGPDSTDSITLSQTTGTGSVTGLTSAAASGGVATDTVTGNTAGPVTLQASGTINSVAKTSNTLSFTVTFGTATQIVLSGSAANLGAGGSRTLTATIEDAAGNTVTSGADSTDSITFSKTAGTGSVTGLTSAAASGGVATDTVTGNTAGPVTLQANATINSVAKTSNTLSFTVTPGPTITSPTTANPVHTGHNTSFTFTVTGTGFVSGLTVTIPSTDNNAVYTVTSYTWTNSTSISVKVVATGGNKMLSGLTVTNPDGGTVTVPDCLYNGT